MKINIWPINLSTTLTKLDTWQFQVPVAANKATKALADLILQDSQTVPPMVPEKTGALKSTGRVEKAPGGHAVVYGGSSKSGQFVDYANQVHDDLRPGLKYTTPGTGAKFVETHYIRRVETGGGEFENTMKELTRILFGNG